MNPRPLALLTLAFALILAPLGVCIGHGAAAAAVPVVISDMHHGAPQAASGHSRHGDDGQAHFCSECRPDSFVKAAKSNVPDVAPVKPAFAIPAAAPAAFVLRPARLYFARGLSPPPPPRLRTYRIRLQI